MANFITNWAKQRRLRTKIDQIQAKAELLKYKTILAANKSKKKTAVLNGAIKELESAEELRKHVSDSMPANTLIQILDNENVQILVKAVAAKLLGSGKIDAKDDELISLYKELPSDIKTKVKDFAMSYIGAK